MSTATPYSEAHILHAFPHRKRGRSTAFTALELLLALAIVGLLIGLLLPAVQMARETSRRATCQGRLRQIGLALHMRHDVQGAFPAGWKTVSGGATALGWGVELLPHLEMEPLMLHFDARGAIDGPAMREARSATIPAFQCASDVPSPHFALYQELGEHESFGQLSHALLVELPTANYVGVFGSSDPDGEPTPQGEGPFVHNRRRRLADFRRGASHVLFVGERTARKLPATWLGIHLAGEDAPGRVAGQAWMGPNDERSDECELDSRHPGGVNFLWGDGRVSWLEDGVDPLLYRQLARLQE